MGFKEFYNEQTFFKELQLNEGWRDWLGKDDVERRKGEISRVAPSAGEIVKEIQSDIISMVKSGKTLDDLIKYITDRGLTREYLFRLLNMMHSPKQSNPRGIDGGNLLDPIPA